MSRVLRDPLDAKDLNSLKQRVWDIWQYIRPSDISVASDYTTTGNAGYERVIVDATGTSTVTITLHQGPEDLQRVGVVRHTSTPVTVDTEGGETINGASSISIVSQYDAPLFEYSEAAGEWLII